MTRRRKARELLVQALYAQQMSQIPLSQAIEDQIERRRPSGEGANFARERGASLEPKLAQYDERIDSILVGWAPERVGLVERCILRLALDELREGADLSAAAIMDEAIELARTFSGDDAARFVNGVLDKLAAQERAGERG
ncbi:MAG TPA: transcription antitermination factor NusB [Candidatus Krumholzibacteria bacterium]|jgi:N utilization substance protein B